MPHKINDHVYVIEPASDDHYGVTVIPATVRKIATTEEADALGEVTESVTYFVAYDGAGSRPKLHPYSAAQIVAPSPWSAAHTVGTAVLAAIETQTAVPEAIEMSPAVPPMPDAPPATDSADNIIDTPF